MQRLRLRNPRRDASSRGNWSVVGPLALVICLVAVPARAQIDTGSITGVVLDETGAALPGVTITARNPDTGLIRTAVTNEQGRYIVPALPPSQYSLTAELPGFATIERPEITVNVGSALDVNFSMQVAGLEESVTVTAQAPLIESTRTDLSSVITRDVLEALPSRNRDYLDFALLTPATTENVSSSNGTGAVVGGARSKEGALLVDGFYNLDISFIQPKQRHSQDLVQEFEVVTFGGSAEYGRAIGGIINVVTRSGSNQFRGSGYGFFRDSALNAVDFSQRGTGEKQPYERRQWGGTFGGPILENKSFFLASYEKLDEKLPTATGIRPEDIAAIGLPPEAEVMPRAMDSHFVFGKWDHNINNNQRLQFSFSFTRQVETTSWNASLRVRSRWFQLNPDDYVVAGKWQANSSDGRRLHEVKVSYFPRYYFVDGQQMPGQPLCESCVLNETWPTRPGDPPRVNISGVAQFGSGGLVNYFNTYPVQAIYTSTIFADKHSFKFGADWLYAPVDYERYDPLVGTYSFGSLEAYQEGRYNTFSQDFGEPRLPRTYNMFSAFVQDSWTPNNRLTINYGVRWDLDVPVEHWRSGVPFGKTDYNNFGPRFALSYDLTGNGRTLLKTTTGVYYDRIWGNDSLNMFTFKDDPLTIRGVWRPDTPGAPVYPQTFVTQPEFIPQGVVDAMIMPDDANVPTTLQVVGTLEHMFGDNLALSASGVFTRSWHKQFTLDTNLGWDPELNDGQGGYFLIDPNYRRVTQLQLDAPAEYQAAILELNQRGARMGFGANLTVSRSRQVNGIDDLRTYQLVGFDADYGPNADTPTVRGTVSGYYNLHEAVQISGAYRGRTGLPVDPRAGGLDLNGDGTFGDRTPGLEPFSFRSPANHMLDLRLTWTLPMGGERRLQTYLEGYNVLNHENVRTVLDDLGPDPGNPRNRWLEPSLWFPPREVQFGLRFSF